MLDHGDFDILVMIRSCFTEKNIYKMSEFDWADIMFARYKATLVCYTLSTCWSKYDWFESCGVLFPRLFTKRTWSGWKDAAGPLRTRWMFSKLEMLRPFWTRGCTANIRAAWSSPALSTFQPLSCPSRMPTTSAMWGTPFCECNSWYIYKKSRTL